MKIEWHFILIPKGKYNGQKLIKLVIKNIMG
jgi:hypothetical protein